MPANPEQEAAYWRYVDNPEKLRTWACKEFALPTDRLHKVHNGLLDDAIRRFAQDTQQGCAPKTVLSVLATVGAAILDAQGERDSARADLAEALSKINGLEAANEDRHVETPDEEAVDTTEEPVGVDVDTDE